MISAPRGRLLASGEATPRGTAPASDALFTPSVVPDCREFTVNTRRLFILCDGCFSDLRQSIHTQECTNALLTGGRGSLGVGVHPWAQGRAGALWRRRWAFLGSCRVGEGRLVRGLRRSGPGGRDREWWYPLIHFRQSPLGRVSVCFWWLLPPPIAGTLPTVERTRSWWLNDRLACVLLGLFVCCAASRLRWSFRHTTAAVSPARLPSYLPVCLSSCLAGCLLACEHVCRLPVRLLCRCARTATMLKRISLPLSLSLSL